MDAPKAFTIVKIALFDDRQKCVVHDVDGNQGRASMEKKYDANTQKANIQKTMFKALFCMCAWDVLV